MTPRLSFVAVLAVALLTLTPLAEAQQPGVRAESGGVAVGGSVSGSTINVGVTEEMRAALARPYEELSDTQKKVIVRLEAELELNKRQIRTAFETLGEADIPPERLADKFVEIAKRFKALQATALAQPGDDAKIVALKAEAQKAIEGGDLAKADALLADVESEQRGMLDRLAVNAADTSARRGDIALARLRYSDAARHFANAAAELPVQTRGEFGGLGIEVTMEDGLVKVVAPIDDRPAAKAGIRANDVITHLDDEAVQGMTLNQAVEKVRGPVNTKIRLRIMRKGADKPIEVAITRDIIRVRSESTHQNQRIDYLQREADALYRQGDEFGDNGALLSAIERVRLLLNLMPRERVPLDWAMTQVDLGSALSRLGERESGTARLDEAVATYREAFKEFTRERLPLHWAMTQHNLGSALSRLGERESGTARLEEAVAAYREALKELTRERVPLHWAATQVDLGSALSRLGERESGTARLDEAVATYREAFKEFTRERLPLQWAMTQHNLGFSLFRLGERESGTARLEEAVAAYREALKELPRERVPLHWAATQVDLGSALSRLGERESGTARLDEAVATYREALKEYTRERLPLQWAMTQANLGETLKIFGERESGPARLEEAVAAYREALKAFTSEGAPYYWEETQKNLDAALKLLDERKRNTKRTAR